MDMMSLLVLLQVTPESFFSELLKSTPTLGLVGFFLYYFMKELKAEREINERIRKAYEDKIDKLIEKLGEVNNRSLDAINRHTQSSVDLTEVILDLKETIVNNRKS